MTPDGPVVCPACQHEQRDQEAGFCAKCRFPLSLIAGKYRLVRKLGEGGFGYVYLAEHIRLQQEAERVVKIIKPEIFKLDPTMGVRFEREVQMTSILSQKCQHIVRIYDDFGDVPALGHFYVMEYLQGQPVSAFLQDDDALPPLAWCVHVFGQLCDAMRRAHEMDIIHRDLKPDNLMLIEYGDEPHFLKVLDFGIAKPTDDAANETGSANLTQGVLGTPVYMAPELFGEGASFDFRVDLYAMGVILYELLVGRPPFLPTGRGQMSFFRLLSSHMTEPPPSLRELRPDREIPEALEDAVMRALRKAPGERFSSAMAFKEAVYQAIGHDANGPALAVPPLPTPGSSGTASTRTGEVLVDAPRPTPHFTPAGASSPFEQASGPMPSLPQEESTSLLPVSLQQRKELESQLSDPNATAILKPTSNTPARLPQPPLPSQATDTPSSTSMPTTGLAPGAIANTPFPSLQPPAVLPQQRTPSSLPTPPHGATPAPAAAHPVGGSQTGPSSARAAPHSMTAQAQGGHKRRNLLMGLGGVIGGLTLAAFVLIFQQGDPPATTPRKRPPTSDRQLPGLQPSPPALPRAQAPRQKRPVRPLPIRPLPIRPLPIRPFPTRPLPAAGRPSPTRRRHTRRRHTRRRRTRRYRRRHRRRRTRRRHSRARPSRCPDKRHGIKWHPVRLRTSRAHIQLHTNGPKKIMRLRGKGRYCVWFQSHIATLVVTRPGYKRCTIKLRRLPRRLHLTLRRPGDDTDRRDYCSF